MRRMFRKFIFLLMGVSIFGSACWAQQDLAISGLIKVRLMRDEDPFGASELVWDSNFRASIQQIKDAPLKERALWEIADIHLSAANKYPRGNAYAKRAVSSWKDHIDFATLSGTDFRIQSAVRYVQDSFIQAGDPEPMFEYLATLDAKFVNNEVIDRWGATLRTCTSYNAAINSWDTACAQTSCRSLISEYFTFSERWLDEFRLRPEAKQTYRVRFNRIPVACRAG